jgi:Spy/CpxP family protein refolding chaperone
MERLEKNQPSIALTAEQKAQLADIDSTYKAKIAEKELLLGDEMRKAQAAGNFDELEKLEKQLASEIARLREDCEAKKEKLRASFAKRAEDKR